MKVLVIHTKYRFCGGEDSVVLNEIKLLESLGNEVHLLQFCNDGNTFLKVLQLPFNYAAFSLTRKTLSAFKPDIIHIHNLHFAASPSVLYAIKKHKVPFVMTLHNYRLLCPSATLFANGKLFLDSVKKLWPSKAIQKRVYLNSKILTFWLSISMAMHQVLRTWQLPGRFIVLGEHSKDLFINSKLGISAERFVVKPNFCYAQVINEKISTEKYYLYVGRLSEEKGIRVLLKAFAINRLSLKIVGTGPLESTVRRYAAQYVNIHHSGSLNNADVHRLLKNASALIFPSLWYETFGMTIIEAFANGTPVIASNLGQLKTLVSNQYNGLHFEPGNESDLIKKVALFENFSNKIRLSYRENAYKTYLQKFSPEVNAQQLLSIYASVISASIP